ncbi:MAG TPA: antitoxin Xre/MbcA/ParS toxin-binding domain-containing protein [Parafilimonas sp.]|nr:antitoxin Xre/MbcA/ParS toxin-binding domain-containing protein [Parafilimonas sp.]
MAVATKKITTRVKDEKQELLQDVEQYILKNQSADLITWRLLGGRYFMQNKPVSTFDFVAAGTRGIRKRSVAALAHILDIPMRTMAHMLNLSEKTLGRKKPDDLLDKLPSSLSIEIAQTVARGIELFEDRDKFNRWLQKENRALRGQKPFDLLNTPTGIKLVNQVLGRIEEGVYS